MTSTALTTPPPGGTPPPSPFAGLGRKFDAALSRGLNHIVRRALGPYQTAVVRIGFAATWLFFLVREIPHRHELYGPDSPWGWELAERLVSDNGAFTVLMWTNSPVWFECVYFFGIAAAVGMLLGWRTRAMTVFFMIGVLSLQNRSVFMGDGGDNVIRLMAVYLVLTRCAQVWSLDARRRARHADGLARPHDPVGLLIWAASGLALVTTTAGGLLSGWVWPLFLWGLWLVHGLWWILERHWPGEPRLVCDVVGNLVHNAALFVIMAQVCLIYATAGWYKIQGSRWQDGTAVYYPLNLDYFTPFPEVSQLLAANGTLVMAMTYGTVLLQVAFPFALLNRKVKNVFLAFMITEHVGIAILMGLPFFSLAMIAMDIVFLPTAFLLWLGYRTRWATGPFRRLLPAARRADPGPGGTGPNGAPERPAVPGQRAGPATAGEETAHRTAAGQPAAAAPARGDEPGGRAGDGDQYRDGDRGSSDGRDPGGGGGNVTDHVTGDSGGASAVPSQEPAGRADAAGHAAQPPATGPAERS